jgi:ATP-dependent RNA helicase DeaD
MNVGRRNNADPRWLLPVICRVGHVTRKDVGTIRIFDRDTKFEIAEHAAARFAASAARTPEDEDIRIEPAVPGEAHAPRKGDGPKRRSGSGKPSRKGAPPSKPKRNKR